MTSARRTTAEWAAEKCGPVRINSGDYEQTARHASNTAVLLTYGRTPEAAINKCILFIHKLNNFAMLLSERDAFEAALREIADKPEYVAAYELRDIARKALGDEEANRE